MKKYLKKTLLSACVLSIITFPSLANNLTNGYNIPAGTHSEKALPTHSNVIVNSIKADWPNDMKENQYLYRFGDEVCDNMWILVGDENLNTVLRLAFILKSPIAIGVNGCNRITTAYFN